MLFNGVPVVISFFSVFFPEHQSSYRFSSLGVFQGHLFSYRFCLFFFRNTCSQIFFFSVFVQSTCSHIVFSSVFISEPLFSYVFFLGLFGASVLISYLLLFGTSVLISFFYVGGGGFGASVLMSYLTGLFRSICYTFFKSVLFLAWCFSEHVFPGYTFVSSSMVFVGPRILILDIRIVLSWGVKKTCSQSTYLYRFHWFLSEHVFSYWKLVSF